MAIYVDVTRRSVHINLFCIGFNVPFNTFQVISGLCLLETEGMITTSQCYLTEISHRKYSRMKSRPVSSNGSTSDGNKFSVSDIGRKNTLCQKISCYHRKKIYRKQQFLLRCKAKKNTMIPNKILNGWSVSQRQDHFLGGGGGGIFRLYMQLFLRYHILIKNIIQYLTYFLTHLTILMSLQLFYSTIY